MGYFTYFSLLYFGSPEDEQALENFEPNQEDFTYPPDFIKDIIKSGNAEAKWYDWEKDMQKLTKKFPNITFVLTGAGEESDDIWEWRGRGDKYEYHRVEMPPFTEILIP